MNISAVTALHNSGALSRLNCVSALCIRNLILGVDSELCPLRRDSCLAVEIVQPQYLHCQWPPIEKSLQSENNRWGGTRHIHRRDNACASWLSESLDPSASLFHPPLWWPIPHTWITHLRRHVWDHLNYHSLSEFYTRYFNR